MNHDEEYRIVKLQYPIVTEIDGTKATIDSIRLGRLKVGHLKMLPKEALSGQGMVDPMALAPILSGMSGLKEDIIDLIDFVDLIAISEAIEDFLSQSPATGETLFGE